MVVRQKNLDEDLSQIDNTSDIVFYIISAHDAPQLRPWFVVSCLSGGAHKITIASNRNE